MIGSRYNSLDGLRCYAAIGIVMMHVLANITIKPSACFLTTQLIPFFTQFTYLFMMVSAFSVCCGYYERVKNNQISPNDFYAKRYKRLLPFFALMVFIDVIFEHDIDSLIQGFSDLTLCFGFLPNIHIEVIGVGWFIGVVFIFYLLFPFFVFLLDNKKRTFFVLTISLIFSLLAQTYFSQSKFVLSPIGRSNILVCMPMFIVGGIIYLYKDKLILVVKKTNWLCIIASIVLMWLNFNNILNGYILLLMLFGLWLAYSLVEYKFLYNRFTTYISSISLEIYLCHMLFFRVVSMAHLEKFISNTNLLYVVTFFGTISMAILFSHVVKFKLFPFLKNYRPFSFVL